MKKIVLTGGGTAGHITPNIAMISLLQEEGYKVYYIGSKDSMEEKLIRPLGIPFETVAAVSSHFSFESCNSEILM